MKVTRLKSGYRIDVTDAEFMAIHTAVGNGLGDSPDQIGLASKGEIKAWHMLKRFDAFATKIDRRKP